MNFYLTVKTKLKDNRIKEGDYGTGRTGDRVVCLQVHGDAAIAG